MIITLTEFQFTMTVIKYSELIVTFFFFFFFNNLVYIHFCLSVCLICLLACLPTCLSIYLAFCASSPSCLSVSLPNCVSACMYVSPSVCSPACLPVYLSLSLYFHCKFAKESLHLARIFTPLQFHVSLYLPFYFPSFFNLVFLLSLTSVSY